MPEPIRDQLAEAVPHAHWCRERDRSPGFPCACQQDRENTADALLPLVESYAAQQAAKALDDLANGMDGAVRLCRIPLWETAVKVRERADEHRTRAAALDPNGDPR